MWLTRTFTFVLPARSSPTTTRPRKTVWCCAATGPTSARAVQSSPLAPPARNDGSPDGNAMSTFSKPFSAGSTSIEKMRQRRETVEHILRHHQGQDGSNPFSDEDAATSCLRDGATRAGLQSDPGHEHHGHSAAHGRDEDSRTRKKAPQRHPTKTATLRHFRQSVSTQPRPEAAVR